MAHLKILCALTMTALGVFGSDKFRNFILDIEELTQQLNNVTEQLNHATALNTNLQAELQSCSNKTKGQNLFIISKR